MSRIAASLALIAGLAVLSPGRALAQGFIHVVVVSDDLDPKVGKSVQMSAGEFGSMFDLNVPHEGFEATFVGGADADPAAILKAVRDLKVRGGQDVVVVYSATHGGYDPRAGSYLYFPRTRRSLTRAELKAAIVAKGARLGVLVTESCNNINEIPGRPAMPAPGAPPLLAITPLFRALFLSHVGFVDVASSRPGERSLCYPKVREGNVSMVVRGGLFTEALVGSMMSHRNDTLTWAQVCAEVGPVVRAEFRKVAPQGVEDDDEPDKIQMTQTVDLRSPGTWSPTSEPPGPENRRRLGAVGQQMPGVGIRLIQVDEGSVAHQMGLEVGDIIRTINGVGVDTVDAYVRLVRASGDVITLDIRDVRTGNASRLQGRLGPADEGGGGGGRDPDRPRFGAIAQAHTGGGGGLMVTHLVPGTAAARLQLDYGDMILTINGRAIDTQDDYIAAIRDSGPVMDLTIRNIRTGLPQSYQVKLDD